MTSSLHGKAIRSIVAATDFSAHAGRATRRAALLAGSLGARLQVLHVVDDSPVARAAEALGLRVARAACLEYARRMMDAAVEALPEDPVTRVEGRVEVGDVRERIQRAGRGSDLLVLGARGRHPMRDAILGTTAERSLQHGQHPMLVVKKSARHAYRSVVAAIDFSADAVAALDMAARIAPEARITLVHAFELQFEGMMRRGMVAEREIDRLRRDVRSNALLRMHALAARIGQREERIEQVVVRGYPPRVVLDAAARRDADLIAVGKQGRSALERLLLGSVTRHVLQESDCDVLVSRR